MKRPINASEFEAITNSLIGLPVSHIWRGYGSAIFLEFGLLRPNFRKNNLTANPKGDWTLMIEWSWRIEGKRRIWCGSWSDADRWPRIVSKLMDKEVVSVSLAGRLPEIDIALNNGLHIVSCMTAEGDPAWGLIHRQHDGSTLSVDTRAGRLISDSRESKPALE